MVALSSNRNRGRRHGFGYVTIVTAGDDNDDDDDDDARRCQPCDHCQASSVGDNYRSPLAGKRQLCTLRERRAAAVHAWIPAGSFVVGAAGRV